MCRRGWETTSSAGSSATRSAPRRRSRIPRRAPRGRGARGSAVSSDQLRRDVAQPVEGLVWPGEVEVDQVDEGATDLVVAAGVEQDRALQDATVPRYEIAVRILDPGNRAGL